MASAAARAYNGGSGGGAPSGVQGQSPWWGVRGLKAFCCETSKGSS